MLCKLEVYCSRGPPSAILACGCLQLDWGRHGTSGTLAFCISSAAGFGWAVPIRVLRLSGAVCRFSCPFLDLCKGKLDNCYGRGCSTGSLCPHFHIVMDYVPRLAGHLPPRWRALICRDCCTFVTHYLRLSGASLNILRKDWFLP